MQPVFQTYRQRKLYERHIQRCKMQAFKDVTGHDPRVVEFLPTLKLFGHKALKLRHKNNTEIIKILADADTAKN